MLIHSKDHHEYHSPIDRDPKKYGYEVSNTPNLIKNTGAGKTNAWNTMWRNDYMNSVKAGNLASKLRSMDRDLLKIGGWSCGSYESLGVDVDQHFEEYNGMEKDLPVDNMLKNKLSIIDNYIQSEIV